MQVTLHLHYTLGGDNHLSIQGYKVVKKLSPSYLFSTFAYSNNITGRCNRNAHRLYIPAIHNNFGKNILLLLCGTRWIIP